MWEMLLWYATAVMIGAALGATIALWCFERWYHRW